MFPFMDAEPMSPLTEITASCIASTSFNFLNAPLISLCNEPPGKLRPQPGADRATAHSSRPGRGLANPIARVDLPDIALHHHFPEIDSSGIDIANVHELITRSAL
jgi:hypothetical protein